MSDKPIPPENPRQVAKKPPETVDSFALPHRMIARTFSDYIATLYDIYEFSTLPCTSDDLFMLKLNGDDDQTLETLKQVLADIRDTVFESPLSIDEDMIVFGFETLEDFIPLLKALDDKVIETIFDQKQANAQPLPQGEDLVTALKKKGDPFAMPLVSDDRVYFSARELAANMLANFKTFAGMPDRFTPPLYSIGLIERALHTASFPNNHSQPHFRLH